MRRNNQRFSHKKTIYKGKHRKEKNKIIEKKEEQSIQRTAGSDDVDSNDLKIISLLKEDGRATIKEISQQTGIRPSTVHQRIQKLIETKVIEKFTIKTNDESLSESLLVIFLVKGTTEKYLTQKILQDTRVKEVFGVTGEYDLLIKMKFSDVNEFNDYIIDFRKKHPQISSTLTMVGTAKLKEEL